MQPEQAWVGIYGRCLKNHRSLLEKRLLHIGRPPFRPGPRQAADDKDLAIKTVPLRPTQAGPPTSTCLPARRRMSSSTSTDQSVHVIRGVPCGICTVFCTGPTETPQLHRFSEDPGHKPSDKPSAARHDSSPHARPHSTPVTA